MMRHLTYCVVIFFLITALAGCGAFQKSTRAGYNGEGGPGLSRMALSRFDDIPVPQGFQVVPNESFDFYNADIRFGLLRYVGKMHPDDVVSFYTRRMAEYTWQLEHVFEYDRRFLEFDSGHEKCLVTVEPYGRKTMVTIAVSPKQSGKYISPETVSWGKQRTGEQDER